MGQVPFLVQRRNDHRDKSAAIPPRIRFQIASHRLFVVIANRQGQLHFTFTLVAEVFVHRHDQLSSCLGGIDAPTPSSRPGIIPQRESHLALSLTSSYGAENG